MENFTPELSKPRQNERNTVGILLERRTESCLFLEFLRLGYGEQVRRKELVAKCQLLNRTEESVETNTQETSQEVKIEPELVGDDESVPMVT